MAVWHAVTMGFAVEKSEVKAKKYGPWEDWSCFRTMLASGLGG